VYERSIGGPRTGGRAAGSPLGGRACGSRPRARSNAGAGGARAVAATSTATTAEGLRGVWSCGRQTEESPGSPRQYARFAGAVEVSHAREQDVAHEAARAPRIGAMAGNNEQCRYIAAGTRSHGIGHQRVTGALEASVAASSATPISVRVRRPESRRFMPR